MRFRLKTAQELHDTYGSDFRGRGVSINDDMEQYLGQPIPDDIISHLNDDELYSEWIRFTWHYWDWETWMITDNIPMENRLFSVALSKYLKRNKENLSLELHKIAYSLRDKEHLKNLSLKEDGTMTYCPAGKESSLSSSGKWLAKGRQSGRIGRVLSKICKEFNISYVDSEMEQLVNYLKATITGGEFVMIDGDEIVKYYHENSYQMDENIGSLSSSCMRHEKCQSFFKIYTENTDVCRMLLLRESNDKITGRALVWKTDKGIFMDRIYGSDSTIKKFMEHAKANGWIYKSRQSADCKMGVVQDGVTKDLEMFVDIKGFDYDYYPYLDTFSYAMLNNRVSNKYDNAEWGIMENTDGYMRPTRKCYVNGSIYEAGDCKQTQNALGENVWVCTGSLYQCNIDGGYYLKEFMVETISRGWVHAGNNQEQITFLDTENYWEFEDNIFICAHDSKKYSKMSMERWSSERKMVKIRLNDMNVTVHANNVVPFLETKGYKVIDDVVLSPSLSHTLNVVNT